MKLLNRRPTDAMCIAAREKIGVSAMQAENEWVRSHITYPTDADSVGLDRKVMREWTDVPCEKAHECFKGCRYGKGCYEDDLNNAMGGKPWQECHCMTPGERATLQHKDDAFVKEIEKSLPSMKERNMKLLNREPTEEMLRASYVNYGSESYTEHGSLFRAMYDAAPVIATNSEPISSKLVQDMKPVAWILPTDPVRIVDHMNFNANYGGTVKPLYSAEQVATLQADNERLLNECDVLSYRGKRWEEESKKVIALTLERDELLGALKQVIQAVRSSSRPGDTVAKMEKQLSDIEAARDMANAILAKHEGEKHD